MATIVEFVGLPGAGKTTLSRKVGQVLTKQGETVIEPTYTIESRSTIHRVVSKARFMISNLIYKPSHASTITQRAINVDQPSISDLVRVLFNIQYVSGLVVTHKSSHSICLLDQGLYQGVWSIGLRSRDDWQDIIDLFAESFRSLGPDLVVFVEAADTTISNRLSHRVGDDTRFELGTGMFERAREGYEHLKSHLGERPSNETIVIRNESRGSLTPDARWLADKIRSLDE